MVERRQRQAHPEEGSPKGEAEQSERTDVPRSRRDKVAMTVYVSPFVRRQINILAAEEDLSQQALLEEGIAYVLEKYGKPLNPPG